MHTALGLAFVPLGAKGWRITAIKFIFNIYTGPGYLGALLGVVNIFLLLFLFRERKFSSEAEDKPMKKVLKSEWYYSLMLTSSDLYNPLASFRDSLSVQFSKPKWDIVAATASIVLFFVILFVFAVFETYVTLLHIFHLNC